MATNVAFDRARDREIQGIYRPPGLHMVGDGFRVAGYFNAIPNAVRKLSPFLLLDYHPPFDYAPTTRPRGSGCIRTAASRPSPSRGRAAWRTTTAPGMAASLVPVTCSG